MLCYTLPSQIASKMSADFESIRDAFRSIDSNKNGLISYVVGTNE